MKAKVALPVVDRLEGGVDQKVISRDELVEQLFDVIVRESNIDRSKITPDATLESLEVQSMDVVMILMAIEEKFGVYIPIDGPIAEAKDFRSFIDGVASRILAEKS